MNRQAEQQPADENKKETAALSQEEVSVSEDRLFSAEYKLTFEIINQGLKQFGRLYRFKTKLIQTALLGLITVLFFIDYVMQRDTIFYLIISIISLVMLFYLWVTPIWRRKSISTELAAHNMQLQFIVRNDGITVRERQTETNISYEAPVNVYETDTMFLVHMKPNKLFPVPKQDLGQDNCRVAAAVFQRELRDRFIKKAIS